MNILFMASDNNYTSGAFLSMTKLCEYLRDDFKVNPFVVLPNEGDGETLLNRSGIPYKVVPSRNWIVDIIEGQTRGLEIEKERELRNNGNAISEIVKIIQDKGIDIVHINTSYSYVGAEASIITKTLFIWHIREFLEEDQNRKICNRDTGYALMKKSDAVIAISKSIYDKYEKVFGSEKLHMIHNGIDERLFYKENREVMTSEILRLGMIGGVVPHKGQSEAISACALLKKEGFTSFQLHIFGKERQEYRAVLDEMVERDGLEGHVHFKGATKDVASALNEIDILLICSKNEAFGRTTVEGMLAGCVVIGADTAGTKEILENGKYGYIYRQGDPEELKRKIIHVAEHREEAEKIRKRGQKRALMNYNAKRNAAEVFELYCSVLEARKA